MAKNILTILLLLLSMGFQSFAQGDLLITPTRVVFEGRKQSRSIYLVNVGQEKATYSVSFIENDQTEEGGYTRVDPSAKDKMFATPYLRFYPRTISLEPGESQTIKLQCRRTPEMKDGEYRSHLYFRSEVNYEPLGESEPDTINTISVKLTPVYGISIPVIIRSGAVNANATLSDLELETQDMETKLNFHLNRTGNKSLYGNLVAEYVPVKGKPYQIGAINNLAVYTNINKRKVSLMLNLSPETKLNRGKIRLRFTSVNDTKNQEIFAEAEIELK